MNKLASHSSSDTVTKADTTAGTSIIDDDIDIVETVGMLTILYQFVFQYLMNKNNSINFINSEMNSNLNYETNSINNFNNNSFRTYNSNKPFQITTSLIILLHDMRSSLTTRIISFQVEQIKYITNQKADIKKAGVSGLFSKFVGLVYQIHEMLCGQIIDCVEQMLVVLAKELLNWLNDMAQQNDKYANIFKLQNLKYFIDFLTPLQSSIMSLKKFINYSTIQKLEIESKYVLWMVTYEFPSLSDLAIRMEGIGGRVREEELSLYIRRKDVLTVVKELDAKKLDLSVSELRKRLQKHCDSTDIQDLKLIPLLWRKIRDKTVDIVKKVELCASVSYQITLDIGPHHVSVSFDKYGNN